MVGESKISSSFLFFLSLPLSPLSSSLGTMDSEYEEDFEVNPFYMALRDRHGELFWQLERESLLLCVPQVSVSKAEPPESFTLDLLSIPPSSCSSSCSYSCLYLPPSSRPS